MGREDGGGVPRRPPRMRPVPQAPVRPLDAGRLPLVRQRLRSAGLRRVAGSTRSCSAPRTSSATRRSRPTRRSQQLAPLREVYIRTSGQGGCSCPHPETNEAVAGQGARRSGHCPRKGQRSACRPVRVDAHAGQSVLRPQLRQSRLGPLLRHRHRASGGRFLAGQSAVQRQAARRPGAKTSSPDKYNIRDWSARSSCRGPISSRRSPTRRTASTGRTIRTATFGR